MLIPLWPSAGHTRELCVWLCVLYCTMSMGGWPLSAEGARLRCGSELLGDLIFVCGDRGIHLGKRGWSGYGPRPRGKGIVDQCCLGSGCDLHHLEKYCAKAKNSSNPSSSSGSSSPHSPVDQQFEALFQKKLVERLGAPDSPRREAYRREAYKGESYKGEFDKGEAYGREAYGRSSQWLLQHQTLLLSSHSRTKSRHSTVQPSVVTRSTEGS